MPLNNKFYSLYIEIIDKMLDICYINYGKLNNSSNKGNNND